MVLRAAVPRQPGLQLPGHGVAARRGEHRGAARRARRDRAPARDPADRVRHGRRGRDAAAGGRRDRAAAGARRSGRARRRGCRRGGAQAVRPEHAAAGPLAAVAPRGGRAHVRPRGAPFRARRLVAVGAAVRAERPLPRLRGGPALAAPRSRRPVRGLHAVAAGVDAGRRTEGARGPLDRPAGRRTRHPDAAGRSPAAAGHELSRRRAQDQGPGRVVPRAARVQQAAPGIAVHDHVRGLRGPAVPLHRPAGPARGHRGGEPRPARVRTAARHDRQHAGAAEPGFRARCPSRTCSNRCSGPSPTRWPGRTPRWTPSSTRSARPATRRALRCSRSCSASTTRPCPTWTSAGSPAR